MIVECLKCGISIPVGVGKTHRTEIHDGIKPNPDRASVQREIIATCPRCDTPHEIIINSRFNIFPK